MTGGNLRLQLKSNIVYRYIGQNLTSHQLSSNVLYYAAQMKKTLHWQGLFRYPELSWNFYVTITEYEKGFDYSRCIGIIYCFFLS